MPLLIQEKKINVKISKSCEWYLKHSIFRQNQPSCCKNLKNKNYFYLKNKNKVSEFKALGRLQHFNNQSFWFLRKMEKEN